MRTLLLTIATAIILTGPVYAQGQPAPEPTGPSGVITLDQLENLQNLITHKEDIVIHFVLPQGWELEEAGIDPSTGKEIEDLGIYSLVSSAPVVDPQDPPDLIFVLDVYTRGLTANLPADTPADERNAGVQLWNFLNEQITYNLRAGLDCQTKPRDIDAKQYGAIAGDRDPTLFVPIRFATPTGAMLYTFTSFTGDTVWMMKFLVADGQTENYGALIAFMLSNTWAVTQAEYDELIENMEEK